MKKKNLCKFCLKSGLLWREIQTGVKRPFEIDQLEENIDYKIHDCKKFWQCKYCGVNGLVYKKQPNGTRIPYKLELSSILYRDGTHGEDGKIHDCAEGNEDPEDQPSWGDIGYEEEDIDYYIEDICEECNGLGCIACLGDYSLNQYD